MTPEGLELVWDAQCGIAESCTWDERNRRVLFCDSTGGRILAYGVDDGSKQAWRFPERVGSFGICDSGKLVVALLHRVVLFDPKTEKMSEFTEPVDQPKTSKLNDGKVGPDGCFWVGSMDLDPRRRPICDLFRVTPDGKIEKKAGGYKVSNGLAWSPDGRTMYHSDTQDYWIDAWDFEPSTGHISNRRRFATLSETDGRPDGAQCDVEGNYWSPGAYGGRINCFSPSGELTLTIELPFPTPTMLGFAEDSLYITTLRQHLSEELKQKYPTMGGLFRMKAPAVGAPVARFADV